MIDLQKLTKHIQKNQNIEDTDCTISADGTLLKLCNAPKENLLKLLRFLRDDDECLFKMLMDITAVDYPDKMRRFHVVYNLLSIYKNIRLCIKIFIQTDDNMPTCASVFPNATWYEREIFDMYGILFEDHADLRRILTDYGFSGYPLRKDFPLTGFVELRYNNDEKKVMYDDVNLVQNFRTFDFDSPWEGMDTIFPKSTTTSQKIPPEKNEKENI